MAYGESVTERTWILAWRERKEQRRLPTLLSPGRKRKQPLDPEIEELLSVLESG
jgi:hypothetical protein